MKILSEEKIKVLAERNGWSPSYAQGYVDGESYRRRGTAPSKYAQIGIDEYCLGFRAGYYERSRPGPAPSAKPDSSIRMRKSTGRS
jgi:hypothetical protein